MSPISMVHPCTVVSLSSAEVWRIPLNSFKFSVVLRGKPLPKNGRNSATRNSHHLKRQKEKFTFRAKALRRELVGGGGGVGENHACLYE